MNKSRVTIFKCLVLGILLIGLDLGFRSVTNSRLMMLDRIPLVGDWVFWTRSHNQGIIFGEYSFDWVTLAPDPMMVYILPSITWFFLLLTGFFRWKTGSSAERFFLTLLLSGSLANLIESLQNHVVTDTLLIMYPFPILSMNGACTNVADILNTLGAIGCCWIWMKEAFFLVSGRFRGNQNCAHGI